MCDTLSERVILGGRSGRVPCHQDAVVNAGLQLGIPPSFIRCLKETDMSGVFCGTKGASFPFLTLIARSGAGLPIKVPKVFVGNFAGNWARGVCVTFSESWKMPG